MNPANYSTISFPFLGLELNPGRSFSLGPLEIHYYGLVIALGLLLAVLYASRRCRYAGLSQDDLLDGVLWVTPLAIVCARIYYCAFTWDSYRENPISVLYIWNGGLAIYGGVIGALIGVSVLCKLKKIKLPAMLDLAVFGLLIGQILGRWGNFMNREAFGAETEIFCRMGLTAPDGSTIFVHPTFLYESLWNLAGLIFLIVWTKKGHRKYDGQCTLIYFFWYGLGRAWIEGLRTDSLYIGSTNIRVSQALSIVLVLISLILLIRQSRRPHPPEKLYVNRVRAEEAAKEETESTCAKEDK